MAAYRDGVGSAKLCAEYQISRQLLHYWDKNTARDRVESGVPVGENRVWKVRVLPGSYIGD